MSTTTHRRAYPSDLSTPRWNRLVRLLPPDLPSGEKSCRGRLTGRYRSTDLREVINAINYRWQTRCAWRMLPHDLPPWQTVYTYYRDWEVTGVMKIIRHVLLADYRDPIGLEERDDLDEWCEEEDASTLPFDRPASMEGASNRQHNLTA